MLDIVRELVHDLVIIVFVAVLLQFLMPRSSFQRYVQMVAGLMIIVVLLTPLRKILFWEQELVPAISYADLNVEEFPLTTQLESINEGRKKMILDILRERILAEVEVRLTAHDLSIERASVDFCKAEETSDFGSIEVLHLVVREAEDLDSTGKVQSIGPIRVEVHPEFTADNLPKSRERLQGLERELARLFQLAPEQVIIEMVTNQEGG
ncbi:MAG: stage III sporulation protein AF [Dethiobacteria bacterium]|nr:stage III sporulation protein AF [Bacillota bacterium]